MKCNIAVFKFLKLTVCHIVIFILFGSHVHSQSFWDDVTISSEFAAAHHDKRMPGRSDSYKETFYQRYPETWAPGNMEYSLIRKSYNYLKLLLNLELDILLKI